MLLSCGAGDLENPLDCKETKTVNSEGNQPWMLIGRNGAEAEPPILWPLYAKSPLTRKNPDAWKDWRQNEKQGQRMRWLDSITDSMHMNLSKLRQIAEDRGACPAVHGVEKSWTWLRDWTTVFSIFWVEYITECSWKLLLFQGSLIKSGRLEMIVNIFHSS